MGPVTPEISYTQFAQLPQIVNKAENTPEQLQKAAQHFESLFIDMWLKAARDANESIATDSFLNTNEMKMHQQMLDHEMSVHMAKNGGIGLADVIVRQLGGQAPVQAQIETPTQVASTVSDVSVQPASHRAQMFESPQAFVDELKPIIEKAVKHLSIPLDGVLGQAALETGWGNNVITSGDGQVSHNLFGVKANSADESSISISSMEFELGRWVNKVADFLSYPDWEASVQDYVEKIRNDPRYREVLNAGDDITKFAESIANSGYATDPNYARKLADIAARVGLM